VLPGPRGVATTMIYTHMLNRGAEGRLEALGALRRVPMWALVDDALRASIEQLPDAERRLLAQFSARRATE
jgi:hypothetical protein